MRQGLIFDLDGVLCDTAKYHFLAWKRLADELQIPFTAEDNERLKGVSRMDSLRILLSLGPKTWTEPQMAEMAGKKNRWYVEYISQMTRDELLPGAEEFLRKARNAGFLLGLGSVSKNAPLILDRLGVRDLLDAVVDSNLVSRAKPDPEVFLTAARLMGLPPEKCWVFEDAAAGLEAAHRAGMKCAAVGTPERLPGAERYLTDFTGLDPAAFTAKEVNGHG